MIRGRLEQPVSGSAPLPVVDAALVLGRLRTTSEVTLLIDTGSPRTLIHPQHAALLVPPGLRLPHSASLGRLASAAQYAVEPALLLLWETELNGYKTLRTDVYVAQEGHANSEAMSVLGRDVLSLFRLVVDTPNGEVSLS